MKCGCWGRMLSREKRMLVWLFLMAVVAACLYFPLWFLLDRMDFARVLQHILLRPTVNQSEFRTQAYLPPCSLRLLPCDWTPQTFFRPIRAQVFLHCNATSATILAADVKSDTTPLFVPSLAPEEAPCLKRVIKEHCYDDDVKLQVIPRVAHYVRFGAWNMTYGGFLSVVSVVRFAQPCLVLFHGDVVPSGVYWRALLTLVPNVLHVQMPRPRQVLGHVIEQVEHSSDVARLQIMREYGGIYLDTDYLLLSSLDPLRNQNYSVVMGTETKTQLCNGFFLARPEAEFLRLWQANYSDFQDWQWAEHSTKRPKKLSLDFPELVHVVDTFFKPHYGDIHALFNRTLVPRYDWSRHYGIHLYREVMQRLDHQDSVIGDMARHILYGDQHACWRSLTP